MDSLPLVVIVGPTASGKTSLAIKIAKQYNGEVISADSRAIYVSMDIGAAKPSESERQGVPHWGLDLVEPGQRFTAAEFKQYANQKIIEIRARGHIPILAGGTGLYVDAVIFDYEFPAEPKFGERERWEKMTIEQLHKYCAKNNIKLPENMLNKRYVINTILRNGQKLKMKSEPREDAIIVGITTERDDLRARISLRVEQIFKNGVLGEAQVLAAKYGWDNEAMTGNIYRILRDYNADSITQARAQELCVIKDWQLAKRQITWFKRNEYIKWLPLNDAYTYLTRTLDNLNKL